MRQEIISRAIADVVNAAFGQRPTVILTRPDEQFGDFATNVALQLAGRLTLPPRQIAERISGDLKKQSLFADVSVAGPGFINITLQDDVLFADANAVPDYRPTIYQGQTVVAEYSDPNPFKVLHAGHLYTSIVGDAIANLIQLAGGDVHRVNFGGDVGLHVGRTLWAILRELEGEQPKKLNAIMPEARAEWMTKCYVVGSNAYENDPEAKTAIVALNHRVYDIHVKNDHDSALARIYWTCRQWSYDYFDAFYKRIGISFEKYYPESEIAQLGAQTVREHLGEVFEKSNGAIIFAGEKYGLHTRVFINSDGLPTYEAKDVGLIMKKWQDYKFDRSVVITGNEQEQYMAVVLKAVEQFAPHLTEGTTHLTHGLVKLRGGVKMSSRKGNILRATDVLDAAATAAWALTGTEQPNTVLAAVKYTFLKQRTGPDIVYDPEESVSLEGNSGPYLQYTHARARSILRGIAPAAPSMISESLQPGERRLTRKLTEYPEVLAEAIKSLSPHYICTYLYELAQTFNRFYEQNRVQGDPRQPLRSTLVHTYAETLKHGLSLLGISAPDKL